MAGLSCGNGLPDNFIEDDLTDQPLCGARLVLDHTSIDEGLPAGSLVGVVSSDLPNLSYSLVPGPGGEHNDAFTISPLGVLESAQSFDVETLNLLSIQVRGSDGAQTREQSFLISVRDVNEPPTNLAVSNLTISEGAASAERKPTIPISAKASPISSSPAAAAPTTVCSAYSPTASRPPPFSISSPCPATP